MTYKLLSKQAGYDVIATPMGTMLIETTCPGRGCQRPYRIDELHPEFDRIREALDAGNRSILHCYHKRNRLVTP